MVEESSATAASSTSDSTDSGSLPESTEESSPKFHLLQVTWKATDNWRINGPVIGTAERCEEHMQGFIEHGLPNKSCSIEVLSVEPFESSVKCACCVDPEIRKKYLSDYVY